MKIVIHEEFVMIHEECLLKFFLANKLVTRSAKISSLVYDSLTG